MGFQTPEHRAAEARVKEQLAAVWQCEIQGFGALAPVDAYAVRAGDVVAVAEIKCRSATSGTYPDVFLAVRKWLSLHLTAVGLGVPAYYVIAWADGTGYVNVCDIDASALKIAGRTDRGIERDLEPVILVPVSAFHMIGGGP